MKNRIISVLLAVVLGFCVFSASMPVVASADNGLSWFDIISDFFGIAEYFIDQENQYKGDIEYESNYCVRMRVEIIAKFKELFVNLSGEYSREDFDYLLECWSTDPTCDTISQMFGNDVGSFCHLHQEKYKDFEKLYLMPFFKGRSDFLDALYSSNLSDYNIDDKGNVQIPVEDFKDELEKQNQTLTPKNRKMYKYSWRDLSNEQTDYYGDYLGRSVGKNGEFFDDKSFEDGVYVQPYFILGDVTDVARDTLATGSYYSPYQYHIYLEKTYYEDDSSDITYTWYSDALHYLVDDGERLDTYTSKIVSYSTYYPYVNIGLYPNRFLYVYFYPTSTFSQFVPSSYGTKGFCPFDFSSSDYISGLYKKFYKSDNTSVFYEIGELSSYFQNGVFNSSSFCGALDKTLSQFEELVSDDTVSDYGLLFSSEPFTTTYLFDTARLPANSTVTISGDTVYDYSITDNSTGETSTIYNYVTNNYAYPENSGGNNNNSNSGSGGNVSGNIIVGGQVDVGGKVDINVNINGGGNGGINGNIGDYVGDNSDIDTDLDNYLDLVPKLSKSFIDYMKDFFSWLPKEIYGLIILCFIFLLLRVIIPKR